MPGWSYSPHRLSPSFQQVLAGNIGKKKTKSTALAEGAFDPDFSAMCLHDFICDRQSQSGTGAASGNGRTEVLLENFLVVFGADTATGSATMTLAALGLLRALPKPAIQPLAKIRAPPLPEMRFKRNVDGSARRRKAACVFEQVHECARHQVLVKGKDHGLVAEVDLKAQPVLGEFRLQRIVNMKKALARSAGTGAAFQGAASRSSGASIPVIWLRSACSRRQCHRAIRSGKL